MKLLRVDPGGANPPYEQIRMQIAAMVAEGDLAPGEKLPTVRQLAADLGLAVNTVARAYRELETDRIISTQGRRGTFVHSAVLAGTAGRDRRDEVGAAAAALAATARSLGLSLAETTRLVERAWPHQTG